MKVKPIGMLLSILILGGVSPDALAKHAAVPASEQNGAVILGNAGESYPIYGAGGIRVTGGHHGFFSSNMKSSQIEIDGSGISAGKLIPTNEISDFPAAAHGAYFVSGSSVCTLATAVGAAGDEIVVCNAGKDVTITYQTSNGETLIGADQVGVLMVNKTPGKVDKFISDGKSWYRE
jgi:hypothetical protein